jgi:hypothetical protein
MWRGVRHVEAVWAWDDGRAELPCYLPTWRR